MLEGPSGGLVVEPRGSTVPVLGEGQGTVTTTAALLSSFGAIPPGAKFASVYVDGATVRFRIGGTAPTTAIGGLIPNPGSIVFDCDLSTVRLIATTGSAQVYIVYQ